MDWYKTYRAAFERRKPKRGKKPTKRQWAVLAVIAAGVFAAVILFSFGTGLSEGYMRAIYPVVAAALSFVSGIFPFSLYDIFLVVAVLLLLWLLVRAVLRKITLSRFVYAFIRFVTIIVAWFYLGWGVAYFREDFYGRTGVAEKEFNEEALRDFAVKFIGEANRRYVDCGTIDKEEVRREVELAYSALHGPLSVAYPNGKRRVKPMLFEPVYSKMGISGYFGPFFNEIHVNNYSLDFTYPFTLAHEMAHQFGVATESEANLYGFVVCARSGDEKIRYSAYASALRYVLNDVARFLPEEYKQTVSLVRPEIIADLRRNREHWLAARNESLSDMQDKVYDAYLKTNKIEAGQANYSEVVGLLISSDGAFMVSRHRPGCGEAPQNRYGRDGVTVTRNP